MDDNDEEWQPDGIYNPSMINLIVINNNANNNKNRKQSIIQCSKNMANTIWIWNGNIENQSSKMGIWRELKWKIFKWKN